MTQDQQEWAVLAVVYALLAIALDGDWRNVCAVIASVCLALMIFRGWRTP